MLTRRTLGLAVLRAYHHAAGLTTAALETSYLNSAFRAGQWMAFAEKLRAQPRSRLGSEHVITLAKLTGIDPMELHVMALPTLKQVGILDYRTADAEIAEIEEYVGITGSLLQQAAELYEACRPSPEERAAVMSGQLAAYAPMTERNHLDTIMRSGISEAAAREGMKAAAAARMLIRQASKELRDNIVYNEHVWTTGVVEISGFLRSLPSEERETMLGIVEGTHQRPGFAINNVARIAPEDKIVAARRVGLIDAVTVQAGSSRQTYAFSPLLERDLAARETTDALHERKLFVAHIMFGHEFGTPATGRIDNPVVLVDRLLRRGSVGPASAISTDYALPEAYGIVRVERSHGTQSRLHVVKKDVIEDSLELLKKGFRESRGLAAEGRIEALWLPGSFVPPEQDRRDLDKRHGEATELFEGVVRRLHDKAAKVTRDEEF